MVFFRRWHMNIVISQMNNSISQKRLFNNIHKKPKMGIIKCLSPPVVGAVERLQRRECPKLSNWACV